MQSTSNTAALARFYLSSVSGPLAPGLILKVETAAVTGAIPAADCSTNMPGSLTTVYTGALNSASAPTSWAGAGAANQWAIAGTPTENQLYKITWSFPSTSSDNTFQGATASAVFNWEADTP